MQNKDNTISADNENSSAQPKGNAGEFLSMHQASKMTGYHQDYLGQLARGGKLEAHKVGRNWFTTKYAIDKFLGRIKEEEKVVAKAEVKIEAPEIVAPAVPQIAIQKSEVVAEAKIEPAIEENIPVPVAAPAVMSEAKPVIAETKTFERESEREIQIPKIILARKNPIPVPLPPRPYVPRPVSQSPAREKSSASTFMTSRAAGPNVQEALAFAGGKKISMAPTRARRNLVPERAFATARKVHSNDYPYFKIFSAAAAMAIVMAGGLYFLGTPQPATPNTDVAEAPQVSEKQVAGQSTSIYETSASGRHKFLAGQSEVTILNDSITEASSVSVSMRDDYAGRHWVSKQSEGMATIKLSEPAAQDLEFDYWVMDPIKSSAPAQRGIRE